MASVPSPLIRPMGPGDRDAMKQVIPATGLFPAELPDDRVTPDSLSGSLWLVGEREGPMARADAAPERMTTRTWNLLRIAVPPDHQGTGVGSALIAEVETTVADRGPHLVLVETPGLAEFAAPRRFCQQRGYQMAAPIRDDYQPGEDKMVFRKSWPLKWPVKWPVK